MDLVKEIEKAVKEHDPERRVEVTECYGVKPVKEVPHVYFEKPEEFAAGFARDVAGKPFGNRELIQVYLKNGRVTTRAEEGKPSETKDVYIAEFAIPR